MNETIARMMVSALGISPEDILKNINEMRHYIVTMEGRLQRIEDAVNRIEAKVSPSPLTTLDTAMNAQIAARNGTLQGYGTGT